MASVTTLIHGAAWGLWYAPLFVVSLLIVIVTFARDEMPRELYYATEWIDGQGRTAHGFTESARDTYRRSLERAIAFFVLVVSCCSIMRRLHIML